MIRRVSRECITVLFIDHIQTINQLKRHQQLSKLSKLSKLNKLNKLKAAPVLAVAEAHTIQRLGRIYSYLG